RAQLEVLRNRFDAAQAVVHDLVADQALVRNNGPFQSIGSLYRALIQQEAGLDPDAVSLRHPKTLLEGRMDPFRMNRVCLNVLLARECDVDLVRESVDWLERGVAHGQLFTSMWVFFLPQVIAVGRAKLHDSQAALAELEKADVVAEDRGSVLARYQICSTYVTLLRQAGFEQESRIRAREARQLLKHLQGASKLL
ncbi:MAG: hypothetical protein VX528_00085, partial [Candidatus Latescibacterota bacterium]|nr:hypothetical protein [Candidatus Latescibacterota bacterium]